jgi:endonuclease/exonuclease/phosphatase family metal-dependent hydrolase
VLAAVHGDAAPPVAAPAGLASSLVRFDSFDVGWSASPGATGYEVRVSTDPGLRHVVWSHETTGTYLQVAGHEISEGRTLFVVVTPLAHHVAGLSTSPLLVETPLQQAGLPSAVRTTADTDGLGVTWGAAPRASTYQVVVASDPAMQHVVAWSPILTSRTYRANLRDGATYYVSVRSFRNAVLGSSTGASTVRTPLKALGKPGKPSVRAVSTSSIRVAWAAAKNATGYTVTLASSRTAKPRMSVHASEASLTISGLHPAAQHLPRIFWVRVTADRWGEEHRTSSARPATVLAQAPSTPVAFTTTVATYNLLRTPFSDDEHRSWTTRFTMSGKQLRGVGIAGLQETGWGEVGGKRPVGVVANAAHLRVARHPHSASPCTTKNQPVLYDPRHFTLLHCGYQKVSSRGSTGLAARYATWVELKDRHSHQSVLVVNAHLVAYTTTHSSRSAAMQDDRVAQAKRLVALVRKHQRGHEPVIMTGDYNSYPGRWETTPLDVLAKAGYASTDLTAHSMKDGDYSSFHGFHGAKDSDASLDHVLTDYHAVATSYQVHVTNSKKAPSDHYEVSARLQVHRAG